ncbi:MAG: transketolase C-terminal domain-containing protein [Parvibaculum sp.]
MRNAFADELTKLGDADDRVVMLSGDIGNRLFDKFKDAHPKRFFNCGVAEANMIGVGAGMAMSGFRPVAYTITPFVTTRCLEQIRVDVCYHNVPVTIVAVGAGLAYAGLGPTHHACEDISLLRSLPNMSVVCPGDAWEVRAALRAALKQDGPVYIRMGKKGEPVVHSEIPADFQIGRALTVREGTDAVLLSTGNMLPETLIAADLLAEKGISSAVISFHTVKPLDEACLKAAFAKYKLVATVEEHSLIGGFGAAVAEWLADNHMPTAKLERFATPDDFFRKSGEQEYAREQLGLSAHQIADRISSKLTS